MAKRNFETEDEVREVIESFNNAMFVSLEYEKMDGQVYVYFKATKFAASGISKELCDVAIPQYGNVYKICIS